MLLIILGVLVLIGGGDMNQIIDALWALKGQSND